MKTVYIFIIIGLALFLILLINNDNEGPDYSPCNIQYVERKWDSLIPVYIDSISSRRKGFIGFINENQSTIPIFQLKNYSGIGYAAMIEKILALDTLTHRLREINSTDMCEIPIYKKDLIVRTVNGVTVFDTLSYSDMIRIQILYRNWWIKNRKNTLDSLKKRWNNFERVLSDSEYKWI